MQKSLVVQYDSDKLRTEAPVDWLRVEQYVPEIPTGMTIGKLGDMVLAAKNGQSAATINNDCPVFVNNGTGETGVLTFIAYVDVNPSRIDLPYNLIPERGEIIGSPELIPEYYEKSYVIDNKMVVDLPLYLDNVTIEYETISYEKDIGVVSNPAIYCNGSQLVLDNEVWCVVRLSGTRQFYRHTLHVPALTPAGKGDDFATAVSVSFTSEGENKTVSATITAPKCVEDSVATCASGQPGTYSHTSYFGPERKNTKYIYYNKCTGQVMAVVNNVTDFFEQYQ